MPDRPRLLVWVQHLLGVGHLMRAAQIARAFAGAGWAVDFVSGGPPAPGLSLDGGTLHQLPPLRAADEGFSGLIDEDGRPPDAEDWAARSELIGALVRQAPPDAILIEHYPFGRRAFRREIAEMLHIRAELTNKPYVVVSSVRDILVDRKPERWTEAADTIMAQFDRVLVHADPGLIDFATTFPEADRIAGRLRYTGYIGGAPVSPQQPGAAGWDEIVVSAGGGAVGTELAAAALAAAASRGDGYRWRILVGHAAGPAAIEELRQAAPPTITVEAARPDFRQLLANCAVSVSQAGYNTVVDLLQARCRAVLVPFARGGETEQTLRARTLEDHGLARVIAERDLSADVLNVAIDAALAASKSDMVVRLSGEAETVNIITRLVDAL